MAGLLNFGTGLYLPRVPRNLDVASRGSSRCVPGALPLGENVRGEPLQSRDRRFGAKKTRGVTRSCRTRVPGRLTRTGPTRYRVRVRPKPAEFLGRVPEYPVNLQKLFEHATNDPAQYSQNIYQCMQLRRPSMIMSISGRVPVPCLATYLLWSTFLTIPPDIFPTRKKRSTLISTTLELKHLTYICILPGSWLHRDRACLGLSTRRRRASNSNGH